MPKTGSRLKCNDAKNRAKVQCRGTPRRMKNIKKPGLFTFSIDLHFLFGTAEPRACLLLPLPTTWLHVWGVTKSIIRLPGKLFLFFFSTCAFLKAKLKATCSIVSSFRLYFLYVLLQVQTTNPVEVPEICLKKFCIHVRLKA